MSICKFDGSYQLLNSFFYGYWIDFILTSWHWIKVVMAGILPTDMVIYGDIIPTVIRVIILLQYIVIINLRLCKRILYKPLKD